MSNSEGYFRNGPITSLHHHWSWKDGLKCIFHLVIIMPITMKKDSSEIDIQNLNNSDEDSIYDPLDYEEEQQFDS